MLQQTLGGSLEELFVQTASPLAWSCAGGHPFCCPYLLLLDAVCSARPSLLVMCVSCDIAAACRAVPFTLQGLPEGLDAAVPVEVAPTSCLAAVAEGRQQLYAIWISRQAFANVSDGLEEGVTCCSISGVEASMASTPPTCLLGSSVVACMDAHLQIMQRNKAMPFPLSLLLPAALPATCLPCTRMCEMAHF